LLLDLAWGETAVTTLLEDRMPTVKGPTIARWRLGEELAALRKAASRDRADPKVTGIDPKAAADKIGASESKIRKIEAGDVPMKKSDLIVLLDFYGVPPDSDARAELMELQKAGNQRGWWSGFRGIPSTFSTFLSLESSAISIKVFEPLVIHGLLQTEEYARAIARLSLNFSTEGSEQQVQIRMQRQRAVLDSDDPPVLEFVLDEAALHRDVGSSDIMHDQLRHLLDMRDRCQLQVIPFRGGAHLGMFGAFTIFEFDEALHSPVPYIEGQAGNLYLEKATDLVRVNLTYNRLTAAALSPGDSAELIEHLIRDRQRG
jgi:hypothetical protein